MKLEILSFDKLRSRAARPFPPRTTLISIGDPEPDPPVLTHRPENYLRLTFDDITLEGLRTALELPPMPEPELEAFLTTHYHTFPFTRALARETADFLLRVRPVTDHLICQCQFGQSRSAAVAAAVAEHFYGKGRLIFGDPRYSPNPLVYHRLLEALENQAARA